MNRIYGIFILFGVLACQFFYDVHATPEVKRQGCDCGTVDFHTGVDINAPAGSPIQSQDDGVVIKVEENDKAITYSSTGGFCGKYIVIKHNYQNGRSVFTRYTQLGEVVDGKGNKIREGQEIKGGVRIGTISKSGFLHFEVRPVTPEPNATTSVFYKDGPAMEWTKYQPVNPEDFDFDTYAGRPGKP